MMTAVGEGTDRLVGPKELTPREKDRLEIQGEIAHHNQAILGLQRRFNALASSSCLPVEVLAEIFIQHASANSDVPRNERQRAVNRPPHARRYKPTSFRPYRWIRVTHVCHHWRAVALSSPQLWGTIWITKLECVQEMLARSKRVPLTIKADLLPYRTDSLELVMRELPRIVSFDVKMPSHMHNRDFESDASSLKQLVLRCAEHHNTLTLGTTQLQSHFMKCEIPSLEKLELYAYQVQWSNPLLKPTLTHLVLHALGDLARFSTEEVLSALDNLPLLEILNIRGVLPAIPSADLPEVSRVVNIPRLRKLQVYSSSLACANFLRHISFPATVIMSLDCYAPDSPENLALFRVILSKFDVEGDTKDRVLPLRSVSIQMSSLALPTCLKGWTGYYTAQQLSDKKHVDLPEASINIATPLFSLHDLFRAVPTSNLESLYVSIIGGAHWEDTRMSEALPKLRELGVVGDWGQAHLRQMLEHRVDGGNSSKSKELCMPNLSLLLLERVYIRTSSRDDVDGFLTQLHEALGHRQKSKLPLGTVVIKNCVNIYNEDIEPLEKLADTVIWDGVCQELIYADCQWDTDSEDNIGDTHEGDNPLFGIAGHWDEPTAWHHDQQWTLIEGPVDPDMILM